jgi:DNA-binding NtrC family response regulator
VIAAHETNPLPLRRDQGQRREPPQGPHPAPRAHGILIVDDEAAVRGLLNIGMRQEGFAVWVAADGQEALDVYRRHQEAIDVVLLDVRMPGLDGPHTLVALQALNPQIRCCFMSGELGSYTAERLHELGALAFFQKPFHLAETARVLGEQVRETSRIPSSE